MPEARPLTDKFGEFAAAFVLLFRLGGVPLASSVDKIFEAPIEPEMELDIFVLNFHPKQLKKSRLKSRIEPRFRPGFLHQKLGRRIDAVRECNQSKQPNQQLIKLR
jgi:hypothetical protein